MNIDSNTKLLGAIGYPLKQSRSPIIMNRLSEITGNNLVYAMYEVKPGDLKVAVMGLKALGARGFNVTMPYKQEIMRYLDEISPEARDLNAVNTVKIDSGRLIGYNTDFFGFDNALKINGMEIKGKNVLVIGAGAISGCVAKSLEERSPSHVRCLNRTAQKAQKLADLMKGVNASWAALTPGELTDSMDKADVIINITPVGLSSYGEKNHAFDPEVLNEKKTLFDVIYSPLKTPFLSAGEQRGAKTVNGLDMFIGQAARAYEIWTGTLVPEDCLTKIKKIIIADVADD